MVNHKNPDDLIIQIHPGPREAAVPSVSALGSGKGQEDSAGSLGGGWETQGPRPPFSSAWQAYVSLQPLPSLPACYCPQKKPSRLFWLLTLPRRPLPHLPLPATHRLAHTGGSLPLFVWVSASLLSLSLFLFQCLHSLSPLSHILPPHTSLSLSAPTDRS